MEKKFEEKNDDRCRWRRTNEPMYLSASRPVRINYDAELRQWRKRWWRWAWWCLMPDAIVGYVMMMMGMRANMVFFSPPFLTVRLALLLRSIYKYQRANRTHTHAHTRAARTIHIYNACTIIFAVGFFSMSRILGLETSRKKMCI